MDLFLDCEWADVLASELVSIALISSDESVTFYAERDPLPSDPQPWVKALVYPLLERGEAALDDLAMTRALREFLAGFDNPCIWYDFGMDRSLCQYVIDGFEAAEPIGPFPLNLRWQLCDYVKEDLERWWLANPEELRKRHHALTDARALRAVCLGTAAGRDASSTEPAQGVLGGELQGTPLRSDLDDVDQVLLLAKAVSGDQAKAVKWLGQPIAAFEGKTPMQLIAEGHADTLLSYLESIEAGFLG